MHADEVQHGMGPVINQKSVFLPFWDNYELYSRKNFAHRKFFGHRI